MQDSLLFKAQLQRKQPTPQSLSAVEVGKACSQVERKVLIWSFRDHCDRCFAYVHLLHARLSWALFALCWL